MLIDPTYLRYIFDGLESKSIHQDNISSLPEGLIGVYEESLSQDQDVQSRERFLSFFSTWALFKKEVSASMVTSLLNWPEQDVINYLSDYTKWFNSPTSGTYILYHERLRVFLLEKISAQKLQFTNQKIITSCQIALNQRKGDEWEIYALEHLPAHLLILAMQYEQDGASFKELVYDTSYWNRQLEISKRFDWSKKMLNQAMVWAAKQSTDELIECALNKIDLHYMEQNDAPRIVELVAQNDIDTALQRIESFGGNDKEGLQRKFTLYMLCLMELTLLDSKEQPFRKTAIEKLLNHLDENIPIDYSLLQWNYFFSSYIMFQMACEWALLGLDYILIYKRTKCFEISWLYKKENYTNLEFEILIKCVQTINHKRDKGNFLAQISSLLAKQLKLVEAQSIMQEAISLAFGINDEWKNHALTNISFELAIQGKIDEAFSLVLAIKDIWEKDWALTNISVELAKQGKIDEALSLARGINDESTKNDALMDISNELVELGKIEEAQSIMKEVLSMERGINDGQTNYKVLRNISTELAKQGKIDESLTLARGINDERIKNFALQDISTELAKQGKIDEALSLARSINDEWTKNFALQDISTELAKQGKVDEALSLARGINDEGTKNDVLKNISVELAIQGKIEKALSVALAINDESTKNNALMDISDELTELGKIKEAQSITQEALSLTRGINDETKYYSLKNISVELAIQGKIEEALSLARGIIDESTKNDALIDIYNEFAELGKIEEAQYIMQEALSLARGINDEWIKNRALTNISVELAKQGKLDEALTLARGINNERIKNFPLQGISVELAKQGKLDEALSLAHGINDEGTKNYVLGKISTELAKQGKIDEVFRLVHSIKDEWIKSDALKDISVELAELGKIEEAQSIMQEALSFARGINDERTKNDALKNISVELAKQGKIDEALSLARSINDEWTKNNALKDISIELSKKENWSLAEKISLEIPQISERQECWKKMGAIKINNSFLNTLDKIQCLQIEEARKFYLKGWAKSIQLNDISENLIQKALVSLVNETDSIEHILQVYAQYDLFFNNTSKEKINRLNKTLNLQWALDIIDQFPKEEHGN
jgi:hypothetical protein